MFFDKTNSNNITIALVCENLLAVYWYSFRGAAVESQYIENEKNG